MSLFRSKAIAAAGMFLLTGITQAVPNPANLKENYQSIIDRNPFGLKPIEAIKAPTNEAPPVVKPKTKIYLTGITSIGYPRVPKYVYLKTEEEGKKEPKYYALSEDQAKDDITILQIDDRNRKVKIRTPEGERVLTFATDGIQAPVAPSPLPGAHPGAPGIPLPGQVPGMTPQPINAAAMPQPINTTVHPINAPGTAVNTYAGNTGTPIPSRNVRIRPGGANGYSAAPGQAVGTPGGAPAPQVQEVDPALQYLMLKAQAAHEAQQGLTPPPIPNLELP